MPRRRPELLPAGPPGLRLRPQFGVRAARLAFLISGAVAVGVLMALSVGCSTVKHHRVLSFFFDGVPDPAAAVVSATPEVEAAVGRQLVQPGEHGPYAAKLCDSCHDAQRTNALIVPREQLCNRCHELGAAKVYVHGPLASGGCTVCHDPHRSANRFLLVSASDGFCLTCHDRSALSDTAGLGGDNGTGESAEVDGGTVGNAHGGDAANCTNCHEAHMSDRRFLLR